MRRTATPPGDAFPAPRGIDKISHLPVLKLTAREFKDLPEFSASEPSGIYDKKRWRRHDGAHDPSCPFRSRVWMIGEYEVLAVHPDKTITYKTHWYRPVIVVQAVAREPYNWRKALLARMMELADVGHLEHIGTQVLDSIAANLRMEISKPEFREAGGFYAYVVTYRRERWSPALDRIVFTASFDYSPHENNTGKPLLRPLEIHFGVAPEQDKVS